MDPHCVVFTICQVTVRTMWNLVQSGTFTKASHALSVCLCSIRLETETFSVVICTGESLCIL
jgi:hypothetical protein